eukprot:CAMPEP_0205926034 /NCGR_PEP_ID=MMETSP1325-20131115/19542_1 /ASSEMBLY_ACC=CAM_ASM_000708 /TAXON_ID=236786 /ORGANISM="Florenciella sp., Strain RCC1007" /LENGTH=61 /DNA_ID=CAMNT_0053294685 /DNA_START=63 /DNA_END=244 /DNA_ORIENTATION=-
MSCGGGTATPAPPSEDDESVEAGEGAAINSEADATDEQKDASRQGGTAASASSAAAMDILA